MYTRKAAKLSIFKFFFFFLFSEEEISGVVVKSKVEHRQNPSTTSNKKSPTPWNLIGPSLSSFGFGGFCPRVLSQELFQEWDKIFSDYETQKALRVLIVQSPRTINLFQLIKLLNHGICFAFLALIGGAARQNVTFSTEPLNGCPTETENKKTAHKQTNKQYDKATFKQHVCRFSPPRLHCVPRSFLGGNEFCDHVGQCPKGSISTQLESEVYPYGNRRSEGLKNRPGPSFSNLWCCLLVLLAAQR